MGSRSGRSWRCQVALRLAALLVIPLGVAAISARAAGRAPADAAAPGSGDEPALLYVSDYFSFVGEDAAGRVAFAIDNNRGKDGQSWQAEHFVVLHDERRGWIPLTGGGRYENAGRELDTIPDSPAFRFEGTPEEGLRIASPVNALALRIDPIPSRLARDHDGARYRMGSAAGTLEWAGRTLMGRVIHEYLYRPDFNRLTRTYVGLWKEFHGFYARVDGDGDLYLHSQRSKMLEPLVGGLAGFAVLDGKTVALDGLAIEVAERTWAPGFYRWPVRWQGRWGRGAEAASFALRLSDIRVVKSWIIGGFAMGIVKGEIVSGGRVRSCYGLGELLI